MMNKWITCEDLCSRWQINQYDLGDIVLEGSLNPFHSDDSAMVAVYDDRVLVVPPEGGLGTYYEPISFVTREMTKFIFRISDVETYENKNGITPEMLDTDKSKYEHKKESIDVPLALPQIQKSVNFFTKKGHFWDVGYEGKTGTIKELDGIDYIATLLQRPGKSISCRDLYQSVSGKAPDKNISEGAAIDEGLHVGSSKQSIGTGKERKICSKEYEALQVELSSASMEEQEKIKEQMAKLEPYLNMKERIFVDPNDKKAQVNIKKRLDKAYEAISKANMKDMAKYLQNHIKTDDAYGLRYTGDIAWNIIIK